VVPVTDEKQPKNTKLRHLEYYDMQEKLDRLYADSRDGKVFTDLVPLIGSDENIRLAYRSIKSNEGSRTPGVDGMTINDLRDMPLGEFFTAVRERLQWYRPKPVRRVEIPKPNGRTRPLGIPVMWDRIVQQCVLQILEPICEAKFHEHSYGFRPNRAAEHALARAIALVQLHHKHYVVDIDIEGFFDNVNHSKLIKQMWAMGIRDKKLISIVKAMLKAPVTMPDGTTVAPDKGTPQGGVLSPLLSNIVLNELDWWISSQWETSTVCSKHDWVSPQGGINRGNAYRAMRKTNLKEMFMVRYADDFKIFCATHADAVRAFAATEKWLADRLRLSISKEKSKVVNLKKGYSEFLGFKFKARARRKGYVAKVHVCDKAKRGGATR
jgi:group II intron reverse transcriptase/maturase